MSSSFTEYGVTITKNIQIDLHSDNGCIVDIDFNDLITVTSISGTLTGYNFSAHWVNSSSVGNSGSFYKGLTATSGLGPTYYSTIIKKTVNNKEYVGYAYAIPSTVTTGQQSSSSFSLSRIATMIFPLFSASGTSTTVNFRFNHPILRCCAVWLDVTTGQITEETIDQNIGTDIITFKGQSSSSAYVYYIAFNFSNSTANTILIGLSLKGVEE